MLRRRDGKDVARDAADPAQDIGKGVGDVAEAGDGDVGELVAEGEEFVLNVCTGRGENRIALAQRNHIIKSLHKPPIELCANIVRVVDRQIKQAKRAALWRRLVLPLRLGILGRNSG